ncbi:MAG: type II CAAX endopeptidase family protein [Aggregatilineales bacterium]
MPGLWMDIFNLALTLLVLIYVGATIYFANLDQVTSMHRGLVHGMLYGIIALVFLYGLMTLQIGFLGAAVAEAELQNFPAVDAFAAGTNFVFTLIVSVVSLRIVQSHSLRMALKTRLLAATRYDPTSPVHTTAIVLGLALLSFTIGQLVLSGGVSGLAENFASSGISVADTLFNQALWVIMGLLGVGLFLRRSPAQAAVRLGLSWPTGGDIGWGIGVGLLAYVVIVPITLFWTLVIAPEQLEQQAAISEQIVLAFNTLPIALVVSIAVGIGEEVFFRGALQTVFGLWLTSIYFALLHTQYTLTPASISIFVVALLLGWLRQRRNTTTTIIAHACYNFVQLALAIVLGSLIGG